jgi:hypothetical protein
LKYLKVDSTFGIQGSEFSAIWYVQNKVSWTYNRKVQKIIANTRGMFRLYHLYLQLRF